MKGRAEVVSLRKFPDEVGDDNGEKANGVDGSADTARAVTGASEVEGRERESFGDVIGGTGDSS